MTVGERVGEENSERMSESHSERLPIGSKLQVFISGRDLGNGAI